MLPPSLAELELPNTVGVRVRNTASAARLCTEPWGVGAQWSSAIDFTYTSVKPLLCSAVPVAAIGATGEWKSTAGEIGRFILQSYWDANVVARTGGDSFQAVLSAGAA